jgi:hypothetical protein
MEVAASYPGPFAVATLADVTTNIRETYQFLTEKCKRFLDQFDTKDETENDNETE